MTRRELLWAALGMATSRGSTHWYGEARRGIAPRVDVIEPVGASGAVVLLHGGAFLFGSRTQPVMGRLAEALGARGLAALPVDYRMLGRGGRFEEAVDDVRSAMDWWRARQGMLGRPVGRLGVLGTSAGAALAAVAATEGGADAWVGVYGPYDFERLPGQPALELPTRWLLQTTEPEELRRRSPLVRACGELPTLLVHGTRDRLVPVAHSEALVAARRAAGLPVELVRVDAGHGYLRRGEAEVARQTVDRVADFLGRTVGEAG